MTKNSDRERGKNIFESLTYIDDELIERSDKMRGIKENLDKKLTVTKMNKWVKTGSIAAGLLLVISVGMLFGRKNIFKKDKTKEVMNESENGAESKDIGKNGEIIEIQRWENMSLEEKYTECSFEKTVYDSYAHKIDGNLIESRIGESVIRGEDVYNEKVYELTVDTFKIRGISQECSIAVKADDEYYVYCNSAYSPQTLGQFIDDLNLRENLTVGNIYKERENIQYSEPDIEKVFEILFADVAADNVRYGIDDSTETDSIRSIYNIETEFYREGNISISSNIEVLGIENKSLVITENGYLGTNILGTLKLFYIGEDNTKAFMGYVENNLEKSEINMDYSNGSAE